MCNRDSCVYVRSNLRYSMCMVHVNWLSSCKIVLLNIRQLCVLNIRQLCVLNIRRLCVCKMITCMLNGHAQI
jgi:hypothetical protein